MGYKKVGNVEVISVCPNCKLFPDPLSRCTLKIKRYKHYGGFYPLWLCEPNEQFHKWYNAIDWESVKFAELIATARNGIDR